MNGVRIEIELSGAGGTLPTLDEALRQSRHAEIVRPGEQLEGEFRIANCSERKLRAAECSILWYTVGKGDEDLQVHALERFQFEADTREHPAAACRVPDLPGAGSRPNVSSCTRLFSFTLPPSPQSYDGVIVKIRWCVRVRAFLSGGQEIVSERPFVLGQTSAARLADPISEMTS